MERITEGFITVFTLIVGVAILATLVSNKANTSQVVSSIGSAFANSLSAATGPVTGAVSAPNVGGASGFGNLGGLGSLQVPSFNAYA